MTKYEMAVIGLSRGWTLPGKRTLQKMCTKLLGNRGKTYHVETLNDFKMEVGVKDLIENMICFTGTYDPYTTSVFEDMVFPGDTVLDVGANIGWMTLVAAHKATEAGSVIAFEGNPDNCHKLLRNKELNNFQNILVVNTLVGDRNDAEQKLFLPKDWNMGHSSLSNELEGIDSTRFVTNQMITLSDYLLGNNIQHVDVVKIDVEGAEILVLRGMMDVLQSNQAPTIFMEINDEYLRSFGSNSTEVYNLLTDIGYVIYYTSEASNIIFKIEHPSDIPQEWGNWICLKRNSRRQESLQDKFVFRGAKVDTR